MADHFNLQLALTGDSLITRRIAVYDDPPTRQLLELLRAADVSFTNLETVPNNFQGYPVEESGGAHLGAHEWVLDELVSVQTSHWVGRSPRGSFEDFQAVRLVYRATCPEPREARVLDVGGTTESARWVPLAEWQKIPWTHNWEHLLGQLLR